MPDTKILIILVISTVFCLVVSAVTVPQNNYSLIIHALSIGFVISAIFYFIVVYFPETQKRQRVHRSLEKQYTEFKLSCISTFLIVSDSQQYQNHEMLLDQEEFKRYFKNNILEHQTRWDAVANGLQSNEYYLRQILYELRILNEEIRFVRSSIDIHDEKVFGFLNRLSQIIFRMEATQPEYDDIKSFCGFLWELFTGWSFIEAYRKTDIIKDMIGRIK